MPRPCVGRPPLPKRPSSFACDISAPCYSETMKESCSHGRIREDVLRDTRYPLHRVADDLLPYLKILDDRFHPEKVFVFGSFAHGSPDEGSDIDLLIVKPIEKSRLKDKVAIRAAWWPLLKSSRPLSFDLMLAEPEESLHSERDANSFHGGILRTGLQVI